MTSDHKSQSDQAVGFGDTNKARKGVEQLDAFLRGETQQDATDGTEQALPYGEIFQQNYDQIPETLREKLRANEQGGIVEVPVAELPDPPDVTGPEDHNITYDHAIHHTRQLNEVVLPWVRAGAVMEDFYALDRAIGSGDSTGCDELGFTRTYELFFGTSPIKVGHTPDGTSSITDGRHRIYAAKKLGITTLPVSQ
ncbi:MAG: hypothetical protein WCP31_07935 [Chloroflexales bacterium]